LFLFKHLVVFLAYAASADRTEVVTFADRSFHLIALAASCAAGCATSLSQAMCTRTPPCLGFVCFFLCPNRKSFERKDSDQVTRRFTKKMKKGASV
jgi:hypothetical protein